MMELSEFYPDPDELIESELVALDHLRSNPYIKEKHADFALAAQNYLGRYKRDRSGFEFFSYFDIWHAAMLAQKGARQRQGKKKPNLRLVVAARISLESSGNYSNITYCLSVCRIRSAEYYPILRKFHFDVSIAKEEMKSRMQQHPTCHMQYCGEMIPLMQKMGARETQLNQMHPWLSEPRIFFCPMSLALIVDMALHEFPDAKSAKFRASNEWRSIIRQHESLILGPFHQKCMEIIEDKKGRNRILADEFYIG